MIAQLERYNLWRVVAKVFVIINMWAYWGLMMWAPGSLTYMISQSYNAGFVPAICMGLSMLLLIVDVFLADHSKQNRRYWFGEFVIPKAYMLCGGGYLVFAYMCSLMPGGWVLLINCIIQALMCGAVAVLDQAKSTSKKRAKECTEKEEL